MLETAPKRRWWKFVLYPAIILAVFLFALTIRAGSSDESFWQYVTNHYIKQTFAIPTSLSVLTASADQVLIGAQEDRINVLLLGIGGKGHEGANLTDTIIVASYKPSTNEVSMMSIPRDLLVPIPGYGWRKVNNLYALAEYNDKGTGGDYTKQVLSQIFDVQIPYYLRIDFQGFIELVDLVGGVDVEVPKTLSDFQYPIPGHEEYPEDQGRYEHLYIEAGPQHFDGATALKYVRSRHGINGEASDFARAARQQLVIDALMDKIFSLNTLLRPSKIKRIQSNLEENIDTNLSLEEFSAFAKLAGEYLSDKTPVLSQVLSDGPSGALQAASYGGAFVLEPKVEDFSELKFIAANIFDPSATFNRPDPETSGLPRIVLESPVEAKDKATLEVQNGTFVNGLARATQDKLVELGYSIVSIGNAESRDYDKTIIYDFSHGRFPDTLDFLAANYTDNIVSQIPLGVTSSADFLIILGIDAAY